MGDRGAKQKKKHPVMYQKELNERLDRHTAVFNLISGPVRLKSTFEKS